MALIPAHNPLDVQVVIDADGRTLAGGAWGAVEPTDEVAAAVEAGRLLAFPDGLPGDADPAILAAVGLAGDSDASTTADDDTKSTTKRNR